MKETNYLTIDEKTRVRVTVDENNIELRMEVLWEGLQNNPGWHTTSRFLRFPRDYAEQLKRLIDGDPAVPVHALPESEENIAH